MWCLGKLLRPVRTWLKRVRSAAVTRFFEHYSQELETQLHRRDQRGFFQYLKSMEVQETKKAHSQYVRDEEGRLLRGKELISQRWARYFRSLLNSESDGLDPGITMRLPQQPAAYKLALGPTEDEVSAALRGMEKSKERVGFPRTCSNVGCTTIVPSSGSPTDWLRAFGEGGAFVSSGKMPPSRCFKGGRTERSAETIVTSNSWRMRAKSFSRSPL